MAKRVQFDHEARQSLWRGIDQLACAVRITLGPRGRSVVVDRRQGAPSITRDGIAVAQEVTLPDPFENLGVQMLREGAFRTAAEAGDGTTTATVIAHRMLGGSLLAIGTGLHPTVVKRGLDRSVKRAIESLVKSARPVESDRDLVRVASIAAGDRSLGELVAHALEKVGHSGVVTIDEGRSPDTSLDLVEGVRVEGGYASPYFITDADDMEAAIAHPLVALVPGILDSADEVAPMLEHAARLSRPLLLLAGGIQGDALSTLVINRLRGTAPSVAVALDVSDAQRDDLFDDLALLTGAAVVSPELGRSPAQFHASWLGRARHATITAGQTTLLQGGGRTSEVAARIALLERSLPGAGSERERDALRARISRLSGAVAVIRVGAATDFEREARRARLEDGLSAARSALEEGIVPGGGLALVRAGDVLRKLKLEGSDRAGRDAVLAALEEPARQIGINAGEDGETLLARLRAGSGAFGFNAVSLAWGDLAEQGIFDATRMVRCALQNAASVAGLVLTADALVVDDEVSEDGEAAA